MTAQQIPLTTPLAVAASAQNAGAVAEIVASLPVSLHASDARPSIVEVDGSGAWPGAVDEAIRSGARAVVVTSPRAASPKEIEATADAAERAGAVVALAERFAGSPALPDARKAVAEMIPTARVVAVHVTSTPGCAPEDALLDAARVLRAVGLTGLELATSDAHAGGPTATGRVAETPLVVTTASTHALASSVELRIVAAHAGLEAHLPDAVSARPARVVAISPVGALTQPSIWETAHRAAWRDLVAALTGGDDGAGAAADRLRSFAADVSAVRR